MLKWILQKYGLRKWSGLNWFKIWYSWSVVNTAMNLWLHIRLLELLFHSVLRLCSGQFGMKLDEAGWYSRSYERTAALRLIVQICDEDD